MNKEELKEKISEAREIIQGQNIEESYKIVAFQVILQKLIGGETLATKDDLSAPVNLKGRQANEFLALLNVPSQLDQLEAIAYYFLKSGQESVTRAEIIDTLSKARLPRPKNLSDVIGRCIRRGHIIEAVEPKDGQKALQITHRGEKYIVGKIKPE